MFKHEIEYVDFNGNERKEDFYFHLSLVEVTRLEAEIGEPLAEYTKKLADDKDMNKLVAFLEKVVLNSYGIKSPDGKSFIKNRQVREEFEYSQAYAELFELLLTNQEFARKFGEGVSDNGKSKKNQVAPQVVKQ